ncbi:Protein SRC2-like protein [Bienertia sinuspersici]
MAYRHEVEVTLTSAKDLKNINWKNGPIRPYVAVWIDPDCKVTSRVDEEGDTDPKWNQTLIVPLNCPIEDATLYFDVVHHASPDEDIKPLIGSAKLALSEVVEEVGIGALDTRSIKFKRPSGRPHGKLKLDIVVRESQYHNSHAYPPPYQAGYGGGYDDGHQYRQAPAYGEPTPYGGDPGYGQPAHGYGHGYEHHEEEKKKEGLGMGAGIAIGAAAGVVGGVALYAGYDYLTKSDDEEEAVEESKDDDDEDDE